MFDVVAQLLGYGAGAAPKRELLLKEGMIFLALPLDFRRADYFGVFTVPSPSMAVVNKIEKQRQPYGPRGGGGTSGYRRMAQ